MDNMQQLMPPQYGLGCKGSGWRASPPARSTAGVNRVQLHSFSTSKCNKINLMACAGRGGWLTRHYKSQRDIARFNTTHRQSVTLD